MTLQMRSDLVCTHFNINNMMGCLVNMGTKWEVNKAVSLTPYFDLRRDLASFLTCIVSNRPW